MTKLKSLLALPQFWLYLTVSTLGILALETLFLGLWTVPIVDYQINYMGEVTTFDLIFTAIFALVFGFGVALFVLARKFNATTCAIAGSSSGIVGFFTLLCPICPVFFLSYFGLSASVMTFAPYFWWLRLVALAILLLGIFLLYRRFTLPANLPKVDGNALTQKIAVGLIVLLLLNNQAMALQLGRQMLGIEPGAPVELSGDFAQDISALVIPQSLPFYGPELGLDFSNLNAINTSIRKMGVMAPQQGSTPLELTETEMQRYVAIGTEPTITCEFCCGVKTLVRKDGSPTCGCAHSIAMRGTAAYLIQNYPEMSNADISYELVRQKGLYFPKQMQQRLAEQLAGDTTDFTPDISYLTQNLSATELGDLQSKAQGSGFQPSDSPGMVGGC